MLTERFIVDSFCDVLKCLKGKLSSGCCCLMHTQAKKPGACECVHVFLHGQLCVTYRNSHFHCE